MIRLGLWNLRTARWIASHHALYGKVPRESRARSQPRWTACIIDSQSVKSAEKGGARIDKPRLRCRQADQGARSGMFWSILRRLADCTASSPPGTATFRIATAVSHAAGDLVRSASLSRDIVRRQRLGIMGPVFHRALRRHPARSETEPSASRSRSREERAQRLPVRGEAVAMPSPGRTTLHQLRRSADLGPASRRLARQRICGSQPQPLRAARSSTLASPMDCLTVPKGTLQPTQSGRTRSPLLTALNTRPRKTLGWRTPAEALDQCLQASQTERVATIG